VDGPTSRFPPIVLAPLWLAELLPAHVNKVLFLDADLLVLDSVLPLWQQSIDHLLLAAAQDLAIPHLSSVRAVPDWKERGLPGQAAYFNAGVMLINLKEWRRREVSAAVLGYIRQVDCDFLHQTALNALFHGSWSLIHPRWNLISGLAGRPWYRPATDDWSEAMANPAIVHFAGTLKPWLGGLGGPFGPLYLGWLSRLGQPPSGWKARLTLCYDAYLRRWLYRWERLFWERGWI
jgi:lipopolysaccharide biosynthesis glycosyltransferase